MTRRTLFRWIALVIFAASVSFASSTGTTLLLVPRTRTMVRVGVDMANRADVLLVSYKVDSNGVVSLHGWTGSRWGIVTIENFRSGSFLQTELKSAVAVGPKGGAVPAAVLPPKALAPSLYQINTSEVRPVLHLLGRYLDFKYKDWQWCAERYGFPMTHINPGGLKLSWYHRRPGEQLKNAAAVVAADLRFWQIIREPVPEAVPPEKAENPLTCELPPAIVLGAGEAVETNIVEEASGE